MLRGINIALGAVGIESPAINSLTGAPNVEPLGDTYFSTTPFRYGDNIAKFSVRPIAPAMTALSGKAIDVDGRENAIRENVQAEMRGIDAEWEFRVQLCRDLTKQPIEDSTIPRDEDDAPFQRVGVIRARAQDSWRDANVKAVEDEMRFSVWTSLAAHQPLGNINRARRDTYRHSADFRAGFNRCPYHGRRPDVFCDRLRNADMQLRRFNVTVGVFDPERPEEDEDFILAVDSPDAEHAPPRCRMRSRSRRSSRTTGHDPWPSAASASNVAGSRTDRTFAALPAPTLASRASSGRRST